MQKGHHLHDLLFKKLMVTMVKACYKDDLNAKKALLCEMRIIIWELEDGLAKYSDESTREHGEWEG